MQVSARFGLQFTPPPPVITFNELPARLTLDRIINVVSEVTGVKKHEIKSVRQERKVSEARHLVYYAAAELTTLSFGQIGRTLLRDHSTIMHGRKRIIKKMAENQNVVNLRDEIFRRLG